MIKQIFLNLLLNFISNNECQHEKISPTSDGEYCPDCGHYIVNEWYITRCKCCGVKLQSVKKGNSITPAEKFCHNCGGSDFFVEKLSKIDFVNIHYAVHIKRSIELNSFNNTTQCWQDEQFFEKPKLLPLNSTKNII